jgi:predicted RNA binding protein YcfA (HicA-like mRNA interferase family)
MGQADKIREAFFACSGTFSYREFVKLLNSLGYKLLKPGKTSGSRRRFFHPATEHMIYVHEPHPGDEMGKGTVRGLQENLKEQGWQ